MSRADRVAGRLSEKGVDLLLVTHLPNLRYLTGFTGSNGMAVVGDGVRRFVTDFRYVEQAAEQVPDFDREQGPQDFLTALETGWPEGELTLGFEDDHMSVRAHQRLRAVLPDRIALKAAGGVVEAERAVKEPGEVEKVAAAAALVDEVYDWLPSFPSIVASGPRGALPHARPGSDVIERGTLVTLDMGVVLDGYCSDCTRTWATGELPDELAEIYEVTLRAQIAALDAVRPGPTGAEVDAVARDMIAEAGHGEHVGHGLGPGVGVEVHEGPRLARTAKQELVAGNVVTVEPGIYLPGRGGVRIEDLVVVTDEGRDVLTSTTKELVQVG